VKRDGDTWSLSVPLGAMAWKMIRLGESPAQ
jgi:hypothetical protein